MALEVYNLYIPDDIPPGQFAGKLIKAVYTDTKESVFPCDSVYGKDWKKAISYLKKKKAFEESKTRDAQSHVSTTHPMPFMQWRVPSRYSDKGRPTSREARLLQEVEDQRNSATIRRCVSKSVRRMKSSRFDTGIFFRSNHKMSHTTHHVPPQGKFRPIKSEQQEHMEQVLRRDEEIRKIIESKPTILPRLSLSAQPQRSKHRSLEPKTFSAAERWLKRNPGQEKLASRVLQQFRTSEVDKVLEKTIEPNAQKAVEVWLKNATEKDRKAAINFFSSVAGTRFVGGESGSHPASNKKGDGDARLRAILGTLEKNRGGVPSQAYQRHQTVDDGIKALMKAARRKHLRLLSPDTRMRHKEFQTWHHMPVYPHKGKVDNATTMFSLPNAPTPRHFRVHPEWELA